MKLDDLAAAVGQEVEQEVIVAALADSTNDVVDGALFFCVPGARRDGHDFAADAIERGAVALVVDHQLDLDVPQLIVEDVRAVMAPIAVAFYDNPGQQLTLAGITGTNGKTTSAHILTAILRAAGKKTATIGTLSGQYTSPPALILQKLLCDYVNEGYEAVVMEVSSHALDQHRVDGLVFDVAIFTNLTQDHLDYHHSMDEYFLVKAQLFTPLRAKAAVLNVGDPWGQRLSETVEIDVTTFDLSDAHDLELGANGARYNWSGVDVESNLIGEFNVVNSLGASFAAAKLGIDPVVIAGALRELTPVPGRVETVDRGQPFTALVDFAHTPDGLDKILEVARDATSEDGRVIVVFGCGGDRDNDKRPLMGKIAEVGADIAIVTSDNPRTEDPNEIIRQVVSGMSDPRLAIVEPDRKSAIQKAVSVAQSGDVVVVAGKGHETTQDIGGIKSLFDDRLVLAEILDQRERAS